MNPDYPHALAIEATNTDGAHYFTWHDPRRQWIIVHGTAGGSSAQDIAEYFRTTPHSTHYVIGQDGTVVQCVPEWASAWGNAPVEPGAQPWWFQFVNPNFVTFSIEHVKPHTDNSDSITPAQQQASFALIDYLCTKYNIPRRAADANGGICGHNSIDPQSRSACPGPYPWAQLWEFLQPMPILPPYAHDDGTALHYDGTPLTVTGAFRTAILKSQVPWLGAVRTAELAATDIHLNGTGHAGTLQFFEYGVICLDGTNQEVYALQAGDLLYALARQQSNVAALTSALSGHPAA